MSHVDFEVLVDFGLLGVHATLVREVRVVRDVKHRFAAFLIHHALFSASVVRGGRLGRLWLLLGRCQASFLFVQLLLLLT